MQLLMGMSISRYFPAIGTAGLLRSIVSGYSRVPLPPPRIRLRTSLIADLRRRKPAPRVPPASPSGLHFLYPTARYGIGVNNLRSARNGCSRPAAVRVADKSLQPLFSQKKW